MIHERNLQIQLSSTGATPLAIHNLKDVLASQDRQAMMVHNYRKSVGFGLTHREIEGFTKGMDRNLKDGIHEAFGGSLDQDPEARRSRAFEIAFDDCLKNLSKSLIKSKLKEQFSYDDSRPYHTGKLGRMSVTVGPDAGLQLRERYHHGNRTKYQ